MKQTIKTIFSKIIVAVIFCCCFHMYSVEIFATEGDSDYLTLEWYSGINGDVPINISKNSNEYQYEYNDDLYRIAKYSDGVIIAEYQYDDYGKLTYENKNGIAISYEYSLNECGVYTPVAFCFLGNRFTYVYEDNIIKYVLNEEGDVIYEYIYDGFGCVCDVLVIGGSYYEVYKYVNSLASIGMIYDFESGLYYSYGLYYSPYLSRVLTVNDSIVTMPDLMPCTLYQDMIMMYNALMGSQNHGSDIEPYFNSSDSNWYSSLSTVEIVSRLIYGECTYDGNGYNAQRRAVMWVIMNRLEKSRQNTANGLDARFPNNIRGIATQYSIHNGAREAEFSVINGTYDQMLNACKDIKRESVAWSEATYMACALECSNDTSELGTLYSKPSGFDTQRFFLSYSSWIAYHASHNSSSNPSQLYDEAVYIGNVTSGNRNIFFNRYDE